MRLLFAAPFGALAAFFLFLFMSSLIHGGVKMIKGDDAPLSIEFGRVMQETAPETRVRHVPPKPEPVKPPPPSAKMEVSQQKPVVGENLNLGLQKLDVGMGSGSLYVGVTGVAANDAALGVPGGEAMAVPMVKIEPSYPREAAIGGIEGWVKVCFTIGSDGSVKDPRVVDAKPKRIFDREAIRGILRWKYKPTITNGKAVDTPNQCSIIDFKLAKN